MEHHEKLDAILEVFCKGAVVNGKINRTFRRPPKYGLDLPDDEIRKLEDELQEKGLIHIKTLSGDRRVIYFEEKGRDFCAEGGYTQLYLKQQQQTLRLKKVETETGRMTKFLYDLADDNEQFRVIEEDTYEIDDIVPKLIKLGLIEINGARYELTAKGDHS